MLGFLESKDALTASDVREVALEIHQEAGRSVSVVLSHGISAQEAMSNPSFADFDLDEEKLQFDPHLLDSAMEKISTLESEHQGGRLQRMEQGMLRLERSNLELLSMLKKLVAALHRTNEEKQT